MPWIGTNEQAASTIRVRVILRRRSWYSYSQVQPWMMRLKITKRKNLSFMPMKDVVWTTVLSKRWKDLWTTVPCLDFYDEEKDEEVDVENFVKLVNGALIFWRGAKILKFKINLEYFSKSRAKDIDLWVHFANKYRVEELNINLRYLHGRFDWDNAVEDSKRDIYIAPQCLNSCSSLKALALVGCNLQIPEPPLWNQLKSLTIKGFCLTDCLINRVLSGTPKLEVFNLGLLESNENLNINSRSLKKLKIVDYLYYSNRPSSTSVLRIGCPNLEMVKIRGLFYSKCVLINVSSLTDVTLGFHVSRQYDNGVLPYEELLRETMRQIFSTIPNVKKIALSDWCVQALIGSSQKKYLLSPLSNVKFLKLDVRSSQLEEMVHLLGVFRNVKTLVIRRAYWHRDEFTGFKTDLLPYNLLKLRTIEVVTDNQFMTRIFPLLEFLLKHASMLEKMVIRFRGCALVLKEYSLIGAQKLFKAAEKLLGVPRSSPVAKVIFREE